MDEQGQAGRDEVVRGDRADDDADADTVTTTVLAVPEAAEDNPGGPPAVDAPVGFAGEPAPGSGHDAPGAPHFPVVLRGYERHRVDAALGDLRARLDAAVSRYETAEAALAAARTAAVEAQRRAEQAQREAVAARQQQQETRVTPAVVSERIRRILELAEEEAAEIRANARRDAERAAVDARAEVEHLRRRRAQLDAELGQLHARISALLAGGEPS